MKTTYVDPLIPLHETSDETLTRLSANIGTLTTLMDGAERSGHIYLAGMFSHARGTKVAEVKAMIATLIADDQAATVPLGSSLVKRNVPIWIDAEPRIHDAAELLHVNAEEFVGERRFLLVGAAVSVKSAVAFSTLGHTRRQPLLTDPRFFQLALA